jgi:hypothetical protein
VILDSVWIVLFEATWAKRLQRQARGSGELLYQFSMLTGCSGTCNGEPISVVPRLPSQFWQSTKLKEVTRPIKQHSPGARTMIVCPANSHDPPQLSI